MNKQNLATRVQHYADKNKASRYAFPTDIPGLLAVRNTQTVAFEADLYEPVICLVLQGHKQTQVGNKCVRAGPGQCLIVSHDLPVIATITEASAQHPYVALILSLDMNIFRDLYNEAGDIKITQNEGHALTAGQSDAMMSAFGRLVDLLDNTLDAQIIAPLIIKEIHYRLLICPQGSMIRQLLLRDSHASKIAQAIGDIRKKYASTLTVGELAASTGMSASSFHEHFKAVTGTTPLQFQKDIRLLEARRLVANGNLSISTIAYDVGYESPTQFSREYARKFGQSPKKDQALPVK